MAPSQARLSRALGTVELGPTTVRMVSTVTARDIDGTALDAEYWGRNLRDAVRFGPAIEHLVADGVHTFVEIGPHPVLRVGIEAVLETAGVEGVVAASLRRSSSEGVTMRVAAAVLWTRGVGLDWRAIAAPTAPKVTLPAYPWQRKRYWQSPNANRSVSERAAHPLLGPALTSPAIAGAIYTTMIHEERPVFLADHRIGNIVVFPATGYLELALAALAAPDPAAWRTISNLELIAPLPLPTGETSGLQLVTVPDGDGFSFEVHAGASDAHGRIGRWTTHARGHASPGASLRLSGDDLDVVRDRLTREIDVAAFYATRAEAGIDFGDSFRGLRRVFVGAGEVLAEVELPAAAEDRRMLAHPALLDACLQASLAALAELNGERSDELALPVAIDTMSVHGSLPRTVFSHATVRRGADGTSWRVDCAIRSTDSEVVATIDGLRLAPLSRSRLRALRGDDAQLYRVAWRQDATRAPERSVGEWALVPDAGGVAQAAAEMLRARGGSVT
ncbi:MAG: polyketide synthase dehydratase domain-containing protein, partial [Gemmatimonadaceae bacterium]